MKRHPHSLFRKPPEMEIPKVHKRNKHPPLHIPLGSLKTYNSRKEERNCLGYGALPNSTFKYNSTHPQKNDGYILCISSTRVYVYVVCQRNAYLHTSLNRVEACSQAVPAKNATYIPEMSSARPSHQMTHLFSKPSSEFPLNPPSEAFSDPYSNQFGSSYDFSVFRPSLSVSTSVKMACVLTLFLTSLTT